MYLIYYFFVSVFNVKVMKLVVTQHFVVFLELCTRQRENRNE